MEPDQNQSFSSILNQTLPKWQMRNDFLCRDFEFKDFIEAFSFMTAVALEAENVDHHPNWENCYNKVMVKLQTHTSASITSKDVDLAERIDAVYLKIIS